jgi:hypothetical protein
MADRYVFADEAGNFDFTLAPDASRYFVLCTISMDDCSIGADLLALRRELAWQGLYLDRVFHASEDSQAVRDVVFDLIGKVNLRVDATIFEKRKAQPHISASPQAFYKMAWYLHFKHVAPRVARRDDRLFVGAASLGTKRKRGTFHRAVNDVVFQVAPCASHRVAFWPAESDPCLQVADYCTWAIQRKWERKDERSRALIAHQIKSEYEVWRVGDQYYY